MEKVLACLVSDQIRSGGLARELARQIAAMRGMKRGWALREKRTAYALAFEALGIGEKTRVIASPFLSRGALAMLHQKKAEIAYVDVEKTTPVVALQEVESLISWKPEVLFLSSPFGFSQVTGSFKKLGIPLLLEESAGASPLSSLEGEADLIILSLEEEAPLTTGGGALLLASRLHESLKTAFEALSEEIFLPDLNASLGLAQREDWQEGVEKRNEIAEHYDKVLRRSPYKTMRRGEGDCLCAYPVLFTAGVEEGRVYAKKRGVETRRAFSECALGVSLGERTTLPRAEEKLFQCLLFPLYPALRKEEVECVTKVLATLP